MKTSTILIIGAALLALGIVALVLVSRPAPEKKLNIQGLLSLYSAGAAL